MLDNIPTTQVAPDIQSDTSPEILVEDPPQNETVDGILIEYGIPAPPPRRRVWPFDKMKVGGTFFTDKSRKYAAKAALTKYKISHPRQNFRQESVTEHGVEGVRFWRVA